MRSNSAKPAKGPTRSPRRIVFVVFPGVKLLDLAGPLQVFTDVKPGAGQVSSYETIVASSAGGTVPTDTGIAIPTVSLKTLQRKSIDTVLVTGGTPAPKVARDEALMRSLSRLAERARRVGSICTGAFILAAAGLLDDKRAVTHWESCQKLADTFPAVAVEPDPIFIKDGKVWSSAGVSAGIDLALAMVEEDLGHDAAMAVAQELVVFFKRPGGQSQFSKTLMAQTEDDRGTFSALHSWIIEHLGDDLSVEVLAKRSGMSTRNFARVYKDRVGCTPARSVEMIRVDAAKRLLESGPGPLASIAAKIGLNDEQRLRRAFLRHVGVSPADYRKKFGS